MSYTDTRIEKDSLGEVAVPASKLWGAQTQRSLEHFSIGTDLIPREMIAAYATLKKAAAIANHNDGRLEDEPFRLIVKTCDEILAGQHQDMFPLHVWMTGSGTQFNMNVNEVISNRCCQLAGTPLGSKTPVHPNDHVNMSQSSNDSFPSAMYIAAATNVKQRLIPSVKSLHDAIAKKVEEWKDIVKIGRTHMQDATPLTLGQEWSGYAGVLADNLDRIEDALKGVYRLALGGTAVGTGINAAPGFGESAAAEIAKLSRLPFVSAPNKFTVQGAHDALVHLSGTLRTLAVSLYKIANDIRLMSCGPRAGFAELQIPENEPGSSIMPGKVNPTQAEALTMISVQVMANDVAVGFGGAGGYLEMNVYKPLIIFNIAHSITIMTDGCSNFRKFLVEGTNPNLKKIKEYVDRSLMLVTALSPVIGYDKASKIAHFAMDNDLTLKAAALQLGFVSEAEFDRVVDPAKMVKPYVAAAAGKQPAPNYGRNVTLERAGTAHDPRGTLRPYSVPGPSSLRQRPIHRKNFVRGRPLRSNPETARQNQSSLGRVAPSRRRSPYYSRRHPGFHTSLRSRSRAHRCRHGSRGLCHAPRRGRRRRPRRAVRGKRNHRRNRASSSRANLALRAGRSRGRHGIIHNLRPPTFHRRRDHLLQRRRRRRPSPHLGAPQPQCLPATILRRLAGWHHRRASGSLSSKLHAAPDRRLPMHDSRAWPPLSQWRFGL